MLFVKTPKSGDFLKEKEYRLSHFDYYKVFYFNISQGLEVNRTARSKDFKERLTRLVIDLGLHLDKFTLTSKEFYYYNGAHIYEFNLNGLSRYIDYSLGFLFNSFDKDVVSNSMRLGLTLRPTEKLSFAGVYDLRPLFSTGK